MELTAADIADDLDVVDVLSTVDVQQVNAATGAVVSTAEDVTVLSRAVERSSVPVGDGEIAVESCRWHLKAADMAFVPKERDRILDGSDTWKIDRVTKAAFSTRYVCETTKVRG